MRERTRGEGCAVLSVAGIGDELIFLRRTGEGKDEGLRLFGDRAVFVPERPADYRFIHGVSPPFEVIIPPKGGDRP